MIYYVDAMKYKEIVDRLEERIEYLDNWKGIRKEWHERSLEELKKIRDGKK